MQLALLCQMILSWSQEHASVPQNVQMMTQFYKDSSTTPMTAAFLALLTEKDDLKNCCQALTLKSQCILRLAAETK